MRYHWIIFLLITVLVIPVTAQDNGSDWQTIEVTNYIDGSYSHPALIDYNPALTPSNPNGVYDVISGVNEGTLRYQLNLGQNNSEFRLENSESAVFSDDYERAAVNTVDYNGDGLQDLLVGTADGQIHLYLNQENNFSLNSTYVSTVHVSSYAKPVAVDLDENDVLDLVVGTAEGDLIAFFNHGTWDNPDFEQDDEIFGFALGTHVVPFPIDPDEDGIYSFIVGSEGDGISVIQAIDNDDGSVSYEHTPYRNRNNPFQDLDLTDNYNFLTPSMIDLNDDGFLDLIFGAQEGGMQIHYNLGYDFSQITPGTPLDQVILIIVIVALVSIGITVVVLRRFYSNPGQPLYLMIVQDIGIAPYQYEFTEELVQDKNLAGGALTGIQSLINEITSSDLNSMEAGDNRILIARHDFPSGMGDIQVLLWSTEDDPKLRELSKQLAIYVANTLEANFESGMFDETFNKVITTKIEELFVDYI